MAPTVDDTKSPAFEVDHKESIVLHRPVPGDDASIWALLHQHVRLIGYAFLANCAAFLFGYDVLVQGAINALPMFSIYYGSMFQGTFILPALWQGLWQAMSAFGIMTGAGFNGICMDKFGRRPMFFVAGAVSATGTAICFVSSDVESVDARRGLLLLGKYVVGLSMGIAMSSGQTYVSEISPPRLRTVLLGFYPFIITVGQMIAISVVFSRVAIMNTSAFKVPFAGQWAFAGYAMLVSCLLPESPVYLVSKGHNEAARKSLGRLGYSATIDEQIAVISATAEQENATDLEQVTYSECFKGSDGRRTRIVALLNTLQQFIGVSLVSNSTYFFIMAGMNPAMSLTINQVGVGCSMVCTLVSWVFITKVGRRTAILSSFVLAAAIFIGMGVAGFFTESGQALTFVGVALVLAACCSNLGVGTAYPIASAEMPSTRLRAKTLGLGFLVNALATWAFSFCVPYMFNADAGNLGGKIGFVFAGFCAIGFGLSWLEIPETKDLTYAQIDDLFKQATPTRSFKKQRMETAA